MTLSFTPAEIRALYDALSEADKMATGLTVNQRKNTTWKDILPAVKEYAIENKSFSLAELKDEGLVPTNTTGQTFDRCVIKALADEGFPLQVQKGVLKRNASLYHLEGHAMEVEFSESSVFSEPSREAAEFVVNILVNGHTGRLNMLDLMTRKQFPFIENKAAVKRFEPLLRDEAGKVGWRFGSRPYIGTKEVTQ